jgi:ankyrin repeat protein
MFSKKVQYICIVIITLLIIICVPAYKYLQERNDQHMRIFEAIDNRYDIGPYEAIRLIDKMNPEEIDKIDMNYTLLIYASLSGELKIVQALLNKGADINTHDGYGYTPLMGAAFYNNLNIAKTLVDYGANVNQKDDNGDTALNIAVNGNSKDILVFLCKQPNIKDENNICLSDT